MCDISTGESALEHILSKQKGIFKATKDHLGKGREGSKASSKGSKLSKSSKRSSREWHTVKVLLLLQRARDITRSKGSEGRELGSGKGSKLSKSKGKATRVALSLNPRTHIVIVS